MQAPELRGVREIPHSAYIITSGNRSWIYSGTPSQAKYAKRGVELMPRNAGNTTRMKKVV